MANEIIFNLDLDLSFPLSDYAFSSGTSGTLYFRAFQNNYIKEWETTDKINIVFKDHNDPNIRFEYNLSSNDLVTVDSETLFKLSLDPSMTGREGVYEGIVKVNNSSKSLEMDIVIYTATIIEMSTLLKLAREYQEDLRQYLLKAKKDLLDAPNGLAVSDASNKVKESYLPVDYRNHINTKISSGEAHQVKIDGDGIAWFLNGSNWEQWAGQPSQSDITPPTISIKDGVVTVTYDPKQTIARQKWAEGNRNVAYFSTNGNLFIGTTFKVTNSGTHTLYYRDGQGKDFVQTFTVLETDIPYPVPRISVVNGTVSITQYDSNKVLVQKWAQGTQDISFFQTQGTIINNNRFIVTTVGTYTLYYKLTDNREYVMSIIVDSSMLPQVINPVIKTTDGIVTITYDPSMNISESKWDFGVQNIAHFSTNGYVINNNRFEVITAGKYTLYFRTSNGEERALSFDVLPSELKPDPSTSISIDRGIVQVIYPSGLQVSQSKWAKGVQTVSYFGANGIIIQNNTFTVTETGDHTLYYKTTDNREYTKIFTVSIDDLPPQVAPYYEISNGSLLISVADQSLYTENKYTWQKVGVDYFINGGSASPVVNWAIPLTQKGWLTHYYSTDTQNGVYQKEIKNEDLPHTDPTIAINNGLARILHSQPSGITVTSQKWDVGDKNIAYFQSSGIVVMNNKFYVNTDGIHSLYYKLSNGGEYVVKFNVATNQLEKPVTPPTIIIANGVVTPVFDSSMNIVLKKWGAGTLTVPFFQNAGTIFTDSFTVPNAGDYTVYIKLDNEREYVYPFTVAEDQMQPSFPTPVINITKGEATIVYDSSLSVESNKWDYGVNSISYFENNGNSIIDNKFTVNRVGQHTLYTVLTGNYKHVTVFDVTSAQLPVIDPPPSITVAEGVVTIVLDPSIVVTEQKWSQEFQDKEYFQNGNGVVFTGNTFEVSSIGNYSYYYKNSLGDDYVFHFSVYDNQLPFYPINLQVFDAVMTVEYTSPVPIEIAKIASGSQTVDYFTNQGEEVVGKRYDIPSAGTYTFYWKQTDNRQFIDVFTVTEEQMSVHAKPVIEINGQDITVTYSPEVEALVTEKKYDTGDRNTDWFIVNGTVLTSNNFTVTEKGIFTYLYIYRNRGYVLNFAIEDYSYLVPLSTIPNGGEIVFGKHLLTKIQSDANQTLLSDESYFVETSRFGTDNIIDPSKSNSIGSKLSSTYFNYEDYRPEEYSAILPSQWSNGTIDNPNVRTYNSRIGTLSSQEALDRATRMREKGLTNKYWTSTYDSATSVYSFNLDSNTLEAQPPTTVLDVRGQLWVRNDVNVEKAPTIKIVNGEVTITD